MRIGFPHPWLRNGNPGPGSNRFAMTILNAASCNQLDDKNDQRNHQDQVNQTAAYLERKTKQPENDENYQNGPEHFVSPFFKSISLGANHIEPTSIYNLCASRL